MTVALPATLGGPTTATSTTGSSEARPRTTAAAVASAPHDTGAGAASRRVAGAAGEAGREPYTSGTPPFPTSAASRGGGEGGCEQSDHMVHGLSGEIGTGNQAETVDGGICGYQLQNKDTEMATVQEDDGQAQLTRTLAGRRTTRTATPGSQASGSQDTTQPPQIDPLDTARAETRVGAQQPVGGALGVLAGILREKQIKAISEIVRLPDDEIVQEFEKESVIFRFEKGAVSIYIAGGRFREVDQVVIRDLQRMFCPGPAPELRAGAAQEGKVEAGGAMWRGNWVTVAFYERQRGGFRMVLHQLATVDRIRALVALRLDRRRAGVELLWQQKSLGDADKFCAGDIVNLGGVMEVIPRSGPQETSPKHSTTLRRALDKLMTYHVLITNWAVDDEICRHEEQLIREALDQEGAVSPGRRLCKVLRIQTAKGLAWEVKVPDAMTGRQLKQHIAGELDSEGAGLQVFVAGRRIEDAEVLMAEDIQNAGRHRSDTHVG